MHTNMHKLARLVRVLLWLCRAVCGRKHSGTSLLLCPLSGVAFTLYVYREIKKCMHSLLCMSHSISFLSCAIGCYIFILPSLLYGIILVYSTVNVCHNFPPLLWPWVLLANGFRVIFSMSTIQLSSFTGSGSPFIWIDALFPPSYNYLFLCCCCFVCFFLTFWLKWTFLQFLPWAVSIFCCGFIAHTEKHMWYE